MKKITIFILLIIFSSLLISCKDNKEIHEVSFVSSVGIDYNIDTKEYQLFLYFINTINNVSVDYGLSEPDKLGFTAKASGKTLTEALINIQTYSETHLNLKHLESIIFTETFFNEENVFEFYYFCRNSHLFFHTFEILITDSKLEDLYLVDNMTDSPSYYTILTGKKAGFDYHQKMFLNFCSDILTPNYYVMYPKITISDKIFQKDEKSYKTIGITGYSIIKNDYSLSTYDSKAITGLKFIEDFSIYTNSIDKLNFTIKNYRIDKVLKNNKLYLDINYEIIVLNDNHNLTKNEIINLIEEYIITELINLNEIMKEDNIDIFNVDFMNEARGKNKFDINYQTVEIIYEIKAYCGK
ncbi:MAG: hypothetical protein IJX78_03155 [Bacilli bacterium]|nr:hypothetical protein [Bacilli bacterium]